MGKAMREPKTPLGEGMRGKQVGEADKLSLRGARKVIPLGTLPSPSIDCGFTIAGSISHRVGSGGLRNSG